MKIVDVLSQEHTQCCVPGGSKKRVLEYLSHLIADSIGDIDADDLYLQFLARERLGSTGIGEGVAIPHCRLEGCGKITGALIKLSETVDFDAIDDVSVDLVFALVVPEEDNDEHLKTLSSIAQLMQHQSRRERLRAAVSNDDLFKEATAIVAD